MDFSLYTTPDPGEAISIYLYKNGEMITETGFFSSGGSDYEGKTGGRSLLLHLDMGDELYLYTDVTDDPTYNIIFCVSLEQFDV